MEDLELYNSKFKVYPDGLIVDTYADKPKYYRHNFYCGDSYFWSLDPASPDSDVEETLCGPVPFLLPDSFTVHFSCGRHYFRCDGDYVYDFSDGYGVTDYIVKEDVAEFFCYRFLV